MNQPFTHDALFEPVEETGDYAITLKNVSKRFAMFNKPEDRLKQMVVPHLQRTLLMQPKSYFKEFAAVKDVSLTIKRGETIGIIGRNGSGKSTLLQMIVGTLQPTSGTVNVNGRIAALLELGAGFNMEFTGRENVYVNGAILGFSREQMDERFNDIAAFAAIGDFIEHPVKTYSSGMFVRLAFAVATAVEPDILVVDEALSVGDEAFQRKCFARIEAIKARGGTILFVSHGAQTIVQLCDRAILMDGGEKILEGEPKLVVGQYQRLVNASEEASQKVRWEIVNKIEAQPLSFDDPKTKNTPPPAPIEFYEPALISQSQIVYTEQGGTIYDIRITRQDGAKVNRLARNQTYWLRYRVQFYKNFDKVSFACLLKTVEGVELAGQLSHGSHHGQKVQAGEVYELAFPFEARVLPGTYFFNAGVFVNAPGQILQIHRIVDAIMFQVLPIEENRPKVGLVDLVPTGNTEPVLRKISA